MTGFQRSGWERSVCYIQSLGNPGFEIVRRQNVEWLECVRLNGHPWLLHAFSTRRGGDSGLNLGFTQGEKREQVEHNRKLFLEAVGAGRFALAVLRQAHSTEVYQFARESSGELQCRPAGALAPERAGDSPPIGDALITAETGVLLSVRTADCLPVLLVDPRRQVVAAVHAGWRGALGRIVEKAVGDVRMIFGSEPANLLAALGPSIRACCYEVGEEVREAYCGRYPEGEAFFHPVARENPRGPSNSPRALSLFSARAPGHDTATKKFRLDLVAVVRNQLESAGVRAAAIEVAGFCTACHQDLFFSHRREGPRTGRMMSVIGIRP